MSDFEAGGIYNSQSYKKFFQQEYHGTFETGAVKPIFIGIDTGAIGTKHKSDKGHVLAATTKHIDFVDDKTRIDGFELFNGGRYLVKNQDNPAQNGIYVYNNSSFIHDHEIGGQEPETYGDFLKVQHGDVNAKKSFMLVTSPPIAIGVTPLTFLEMSEALFTPLKKTLVGGEPEEKSDFTFADIAPGPRPGLNPTGKCASCSRIASTVRVIGNGIGYVFQMCPECMDRMLTVSGVKIVKVIDPAGPKRSILL